jgi:hypothetical protein
MGMDVYGRNPTAPQGEYFRASIDQWPLLAKVIKTLCPQETWPCKHWNSNDGDGLTGPQALALAEALEHKLHTGEVAFALCDATIISTSTKSRNGRVTARRSIACFTPAIISTKRGTFLRRP